MLMPDRRRGFSLVEATIAVVLLLIAMTMAVRAVAWVATERRSADRRATALREANNLLERLAAGIDDEPWLSPEAADALPSGTIAVDREPEPIDGDGPALVRIIVTVRYDDRGGMPAGPVRLTTWIAAPEGSEEGER